MSKLSFVFVATALAAVFVAAIGAGAAASRGGRRGGMRGGGPMQTFMLLRNTKVQEDLGHRRPAERRPYEAGHRPSRRWRTSDRRRATNPGCKLSRSRSRRFSSPSKSRD